MSDLARLTLTFWTLVQRVRRLPMTEAARARALADVQAIFWAERDRLRACRSGSIYDGTDVGSGGNTPLSH